MTLLERIKGQVVLDGECWKWKGYVRNRVTPMISLDHSAVAVRRALAIYKNLDIDGKVVSCKCRTPLCVNPAHLFVGTRSELHKMVAQERQQHSSHVYREKVARALQMRTKLTPEMVEQIRASSKRYAELAEQFGVSEASISAIRRRVRWKDYGSPFAQLYLRGQK